MRQDLQPTECGYRKHDGWAIQFFFLCSKIGRLLLRMLVCNVDSLTSQRKDRATWVMVLMFVTTRLQHVKRVYLW